MLEEFMDMFDLLDADFDPILIDNLTFPKHLNDMDKRRCLKTMLNLLNGL